MALVAGAGRRCRCVLIRVGPLGDVCLPAPRRAKGSARACSRRLVRREYAAANVATMTRTRTAVFVMLSFAGSPRRMASRQMATVLNRLGGIGEPDVCPGMALGALTDAVDDVANKHVEKQGAVALSNLDENAKARLQSVGLRSRPWPL